MAKLTRGQIAEIRAWVGDRSPTDEDLQNRMDDLGETTLHVARQVLQERLGALTAGPAQFSAEGDYSANNIKTIETLTKQIADLSLIIEGQAIPGYDPDATQADTAYLVRDDRERLFG